MKMDDSYFSIFLYNKIREALLSRDASPRLDLAYETHEVHSDFGQQMQGPHRGLKEALARQFVVWCSDSEPPPFPNV